MTVIDRLRSTGAAEDDALRAASAIGAALPHGRAVVVTDEALSAALQGDRVLLAALLAEEVEPDEDELASLRELEEHAELLETIPLETVKNTLAHRA